MRSLGLELKHWQGIDRLCSRTRVRGLAAKEGDYTYLDNCDAPEQNVGHNEVVGMSLVPADEASKECAAECTATDGAPTFLLGLIIGHWLAVLLLTFGCHLMNLV